jgi:hypothetical protein
MNLLKKLWNTPRQKKLALKKRKLEAQLKVIARDRKSLFKKEAKRMKK